MRCLVRIPLGNSGYKETYCYEPLDINGCCSKHGQQACLKPDWMSDDQFKTAMSNLSRQTVAFRRSSIDPSDGKPRGDNSGK